MQEIGKTMLVDTCCSALTVVNMLQQACVLLLRPQAQCCCKHMSVCHYGHSIRGDVACVAVIAAPCVLLLHL